MDQPIGPLFLQEGEQFKTYSATKAWNIPYIVGQEMKIYENVYRFCRMGSVAGVAGKLYQSELPDSNFDTLAIPAPSNPTAANPYNNAGNRLIRVTLPANAIIANLWAQGYVEIEANAGASEGYKYRIKEHVASAGSEDVNFSLVAGDGLIVTLNTSDKATFIKNPYADVVVHPSPPTAKVAGVCCAVIPAAGYGWLQVGGIATVLIDGTVTINQQVVASPSVDGAVSNALLTEATPNTFIQPIVGIVVEVAPTTDYGAIWLQGML